MYPSDNSLSVQHPINVTKTYPFFDNVHLIKSIRNNLLNAKKFVFPAFNFKIGDNILTTTGGYISWDDLKHIQKDSILEAHLKKAPKLTLQVFDPFNNKQCVHLAFQYLMRALYQPLNATCLKEVI